MIPFCSECWRTYSDEEKSKHVDRKEIPRTLSELKKVSDKVIITKVLYYYSIEVMAQNGAQIS